MYIMDIKEEYRRFVEETARKVLSTLTETDKEYIRDNPSSTTHHFGLGLYIRNKYIYPIYSREKFGFIHPDTISSDIVRKIASLIIGYDDSNELYCSLYDSTEFINLKKLYSLLFDKDVFDLIKKYSDEPYSYELFKKVISEIKEVIWDKKRVNRLCHKYNINQRTRKRFFALARKLNADRWYSVIPYELVLLSGELEPDFRTKLLSVLELALESNYDLARNIPLAICNHKDTVLAILKHNGRILKRLKKYKNDDECVATAIEKCGEAIEYANRRYCDIEAYVDKSLANETYSSLSCACMSKYRDDYSKVKIALTANGRNIEYASERLKDDYEAAAFAIVNQKDFYPASTFCNLSERLQDNLDLALLDIREGHACVDQYSERLRDNDVIAEEMIKSGYGWKLWSMSKRIREKYDKD